MKASAIAINASLLLLIMVILPVALLIVLPGDPGWWQAWAVVGVLAGSTVLGRVLIMTQHPDLAEERSRWSQARNTPRWDRLLMLVAGFFGLVAVWLVAGLQRRFTVYHPLPLPLAAVSLVLMTAGYALSTWASLENRFFSSVVRIQTDRGHRVVDTGPYALVRHPAYAGGILGYAMMPLALGTGWALLPSLLTIAVVCVRTSLEDRYLREKLPGYRRYADRVRYRLVPGIW